MVSSFRLKGEELEPLFLVGSDSIKDHPICGKSVSRHGLNYCGTKNCEESELLFDLKNKYLINFGGQQLKQIQPTTLNKACQGKTYFSFITESYNENFVWLQILFQNLRFYGQQGKRLNFS